MHIAHTPSVRSPSTTNTTLEELTAVMVCIILCPEQVKHTTAKEVLLLKTWRGYLNSGGL